MEKILIKVESFQQAKEVFNKLEIIGEKVNHTKTIFSRNWCYVGFYKHGGEWIIAENNNKNFDYSKVITADEFLNQEKEYQYEIY